MVVRSLAEAIAPAAVDADVLHARFGPFIQLAKRLLGVEANCYPFMEIWPPAFRTYNLLVPNFVDVPFGFLGLGPSMGLRGTGMYASSRVAECMYCTAHCCVIAARGGASSGLLREIMDPGSKHPPGERALVAMAQAMSTLPATLTSSHLAEMDTHFSRDEVDWLAYGIIMMGFLNKMMDTMGFDLERGVVDEVGDIARASGWTAGKHDVVDDRTSTIANPGSPLRTLWSMIPFMPHAVMTDRRWTKGVPTNGNAAVRLLKERCGYAFPMVTKIRHGRIVRTLTTMLRDNLDDSTSVLGLKRKYIVGIRYAHGLHNDELARGCRAMAIASGASEETLDAIASKGAHESDGVVHAALALAEVMSASPAVITTDLVKQTSEALEPDQLIELITWLSLLSLLHRLDVYQRARSPS